MIERDIQGSNISEDEMGQLHAQHLNENAIAAVRRNLPTGISLEDCEDCGESIPEERRVALQGCKRCVYCQTVAERFKK